LRSRFRSFGFAAGAGAIRGYLLGRLERIGGELASDTGVPPSMGTAINYHRVLNNVNFHQGGGKLSS